MRTVFLVNLPQRVYKGRQVIDWITSIGYKVKFIYDDIEGEVEIIGYKTIGQELIIKYKNEEFKTNTSRFLKCRLGIMLKKRTHDFKFKIGTTFKDGKRNLLIIDRKYQMNAKGQNEKWYKYRCCVCGWAESWIIESALLKQKHGCSCCRGFSVVEGINDIPTTAPWMVRYFVGGYEEAKLYTKASAQKIYPVCPDCGKIKDKPVVINCIYNQHSIGCGCGDGLSYPEKVMCSVLNQLNIEFITQLTKTTFDWCDNYRYDFYIPSISCIIETHGSQHYRSTGWKNRKTAKENQENDRLKEKLSKENHIENYIVIDCRESNLKFIKNNILNSKLSNLINLNKINWEQCEEFALSNLVKIACNYKKNNSNMTTMEIGNIMKLTHNTICQYLKAGNYLNWCKYDSKEELRKSGAKRGKFNRKTVEIFKDGKSLGIFESVSDLEKQSEKNFGVKLIASNMSSVCQGKQKHHKGYTFKYIEDDIKQLIHNKAS